MAFTEFVFVKGKTKWFRYIQPDMQYMKWSHVLYPDEESLEKIRDLQAEGMKNILKKDEDGYYIAFSRPTERKTRTGDRIGMSPPEVIYEGKPLRNVEVGNGSDVTTKLEVYQHRVPGSNNKAKAARWLSSRIDNLVPYERDDYNGKEQRAVKGLEDQPEPLF